MNVTVDCKELAAALAIVKRGLPSGKTTLDILRSVRLDATADGLCLSTTNLESGWRYHLTADVAECGSAVVTHAALANAAKGKAKGARIQLECADGAKVTTATMGWTTWTLDGFPVADYPVMPTAAEPEDKPNAPAPVTFAIATDALRTAVGQTAYAASRDDVNRPVLTCVHLEGEQGVDALRLHSSDGFRMTATNCLLSRDPDGRIAALVPAALLAKVVATAKSDHVEVYVAAERSLIEFRTARREC